MLVLLTGADGQLGTDFIKLFKLQNVDFIATDYRELDITKPENIKSFVSKYNFTHIINCAAYNDVDKAEVEQEICHLLNCTAPLYLAKTAKNINAIYMTYSTDFVFDGNKQTPYIETDIPNPLSIYGKSKLDGENFVLKEYKKSYVVRTSWVFGTGNNNFNKQVIGWSKNRNQLNIVDDQLSSPTYSYDLAIYSWELMQTKKYGLYHLSNSEKCSKKEQAEYVLKSIGWTGTVGSAKTADFNLPAKRAEYSKLDSTKLENIIGKKLPTWKNGIDRFLKEYLTAN